MPEGAILTEREDFESATQLASDIESCLEPGNSNRRLRLWLLVPALVTPSAAVRGLLPSIAKCSVAGRKHLKVAV
jgi:hypothetical protein